MTLPVSAAGMGCVQLDIAVLADRPDLAARMWAMETSWPEFVRHEGRRCDPPARKTGTS